jgi:hypothetical protein
MEDERVVVGDREQLREIRLRRADVDVGISIVPKDPERAVEMEVDRRGLQILGVVRLDLDATLVERRADIPVREDTHRVCPFPFSAYSVSTSRLRSSRSSKLW